MDDVEETEKRLRESFFSAFDKWGLQNFDKLVNPEIRKNDPEVFQGMHLEDLFMSKRVFITGFYRYVTEAVMINADSQRQLRTVMKATLISVLKPEGVSVKELEGKDSTDKMYTRRNVQNILRQRYANTFFENSAEPKDSGTVRPYLSVFTPDSNPPLGNTARVKKLQLRDKMALFSSDKAMEWLMLNAKIEVVFPERIRFLLTFKKLCSELLLEIGDHSSTGLVLATELSSPSEIFQLFANHMLSIVSIAWFNGRQDQTKRKLIDDGFPFKFSEEDAILACSLLSELLESDELVAVNVLVSGAALVEYGSPESALLLYQRCANLPDLDHLDKGTLHENIAVIHRTNSNPKLMVMEMKLAVNSLEQSGDAYRVSLALKNLGEAEWMLGFTDLAMNYLSEAERLGDTLDRPSRAAVLVNLGAAAMRLKQKNLEMKYWKKFLEVAPEDWTERILNASARLGELSRG